MTPAAILFALKQTSTFVGQSKFPPLTAEAAIIVQADTGRILWGRNIDMPMYPASTTKLLTSLILLEETSPTDQIQAPEDIKKIRGSSLHMQPFETVSAEGAAYAILLRSANDVAHCVALKLGGSDTGFAKKMNEFSQKLGMKHSHWVTPHGLNNPWHKTTARDMSILALYAMKNNRLVEITSTEKYTIQRSINQKDILLENHNKLLKEDKTLKGFKTGFTNPAGLCFVGYQESPIGNLITVILNSNDWAADQVTITKWAKTSFHQTDNILANFKETFKPINAKNDQLLTAIPNRPIPGLVSEEDLQNLKVIPRRTEFPAPIPITSVLTPAIVKLPDGTTFQTELVAANAVEAKPNISDFLRNPVGISLILFASAAYWYRRRTYDKLNY
ncbi:MAG: D-alanyl-D-alanine carboxypeptidase family protein [Fimbriimonadaceae bacterium]